MSELSTYVWKTAPLIPLVNYHYYSVLRYKHFMFSGCKSSGLLTNRWPTDFNLGTCIRSMGNKGGQVWGWANAVKIQISLWITLFRFIGLTSSIYNSASFQTEDVIWFSDRFNVLGLNFWELFFQSLKIAQTYFLGSSSHLEHMATSAYCILILYLSSPFLFHNKKQVPFVC